MWTIKAFAARDREGARLAEQIGDEAVAHRRSWMYVEEARMIHDICLSVMARGMLIWAISMWRAGMVSASDFGAGPRADLPHPARLARPGADAG
ncbi:hypothetical protein FHR62_002777 [Xanthomonas arboricola]|nr:hypothetical protein [Xanthomonas arboricola]